MALVSKVDTGRFGEAPMTPISEVGKTMTSKVDQLFQALAAICQDKPIAEVSITELTSRAGVSRMYFYRHFNLLTDIIAARIGEQFSLFLRRVTKLKVHDAEHVAPLFFSVIETDAESLSVLLRRGEADIIQNMFQLNLEQLAGVHLIQGVDSPYWASYTAGGLSRMIVVWLQKDHRETATEMGLETAKIVRM